MKGYNKEEQKIYVLTIECTDTDGASETFEVPYKSLELLTEDYKEVVEQVVSRELTIKPVSLVERHVVVYAKDVTMELPEGIA